MTQLSTIQNNPARVRRLCQAVDVRLQFAQVACNRLAGIHTWDATVQPGDSGSFMGALADTWMWILSADAIREYADSLVKGCRASPYVDELNDELVRFTTSVPELRAEWRNYFGHISKVGEGNARDDLHLVPGEAYLIDDVVDGGEVMLTETRINVERDHTHLRKLHRAIREFLHQYGGLAPNVLSYGGFQSY